MLLHGGKGEDQIKSFFNEVYGYYVKVCVPGLTFQLRSNTFCSPSISTLISSFVPAAVNEPIL
jgi:hypothetical protein